MKQQHLTVPKRFIMVDKKKVRAGLRISFLLLQALMILVGIATLLLKIMFYSKARSFIGISSSNILLPLLCPIFTLWCGCYGYTCLSSKKKLHIFFYVLSITALMNLQVILMMRTARFVEGSRVWLSTQWHNLSDSQRNLIQEKLSCCGFETSSDRPGSVCAARGSCVAKLFPMLSAVRNNLQRILLFLFFMETLCLCLISFLKFGK